MTHRLPAHKPCDCPRCLGVATADAKWGFDKSLVPLVHCIHCKKPIGLEPFVLDTGLARFGTMLFVHKRCNGRPR